MSWSQSAAISMLLLAGCAAQIRNPYDLEQAIYEYTSYHSEFLTCVERAYLASRWLKENGYQVEYCSEKKGKSLHKFVKWSKNNLHGSILRLNGYKEVRCF